MRAEKKLCEFFLSEIHKNSLVLCFTYKYCIKEIFSLKYIESKRNKSLDKIRSSFISSNL